MSGSLSPEEKEIERLHEALTQARADWLDLRHRSEKAMATLSSDAVNAAMKDGEGWEREVMRLTAKRSGVQLVLDYMRAYPTGVPE